jgi:hypothetical protein
LVAAGSKTVVAAAQVADLASKAVKRVLRPPVLERLVRALLAVLVILLRDSVLVVAAVARVQLAKMRQP